MVNTIHYSIKITYIKLHSLSKHNSLPDKKSKILIYCFLEFSLMHSMEFKKKSLTRCIENTHLLTYTQWNKLSQK